MKFILNMSNSIAFEQKKMLKFLPGHKGPQGGTDLRFCCPHRDTSDETSPRTRYVETVERI